MKNLSLCGLCILLLALPYQASAQHEHALGRAVTNANTIDSQHRLSADEGGKPRALEPGLSLAAGRLMAPKGRALVTEVLLEEIYQYWHTTDWVNDYRYTYAYSPDEKQAGSVYYYWNAEWDTGSVGVYTYDLQGRLSQEYWQYLSGGSYYNEELDLYTYLPSGKLGEWVTQTWTGTEWMNSWRTLYTYDASDRPIESIDQQWSTDHWSRYKRITRTYDLTGNAIVDTLFDPLSGSSWTLDGKIDYTYDASGYLIEELWSDYAGIWMQAYRYTYTNDLQGVVLQWVCEVYRSSKWTLDGRTLYTYGIPTSTQESADVVPSEWILSSHPNPFNPTTVIEYSLPLSSMVTITIFDARGRQVSVLEERERNAGRYSLIWDAHGLPSGLYFCRMQAGGFLTTQKLVLVK
jgi:hypothetical protein